MLKIKVQLIISFTLDGIQHNDIATILDEDELPFEQESSLLSNIT